MTFDIDKKMESIQRAEGDRYRYVLGKELAEMKPTLDPVDVQKRGGFMGWDTDTLQNAAIDYADFLEKRPSDEYSTGSLLASDEFEFFDADAEVANEKGQDLRDEVEDKTDDWLSGEGISQDGFPTQSGLDPRDLHPQDIEILSMAADGRMDSAYKMFRKRYPGADEGLFISFLHAANLPRWD